MLHVPHNPPESPDHPPASLALWAARAEVLSILLRIRKAIVARPKSPEDLTNRRWDYCIARELVSTLVQIYNDPEEDAGY